MSAVDRSLCEGLLARDCRFVQGELNSWYCRALITGSCSLVADDGLQTLCRGITTRSCAYVSDAQQPFCRAVVETRCDDLDTRGRIWCVAIGQAVSPPPEPRWY